MPPVRAARKEVRRDVCGRRLPRPAPVGAPLAPLGLRGIEAVIQLHRLRKVLALAGFTRWKRSPDIHGAYESDVERAPIALGPVWLPAVESRGEGLFVQLGSR